MIQEPDVVEKIYKMHFPSKEMEVQTSVSWINDMIELEGSIGNIEANLENSTNRPLSDNEFEDSFSYGIVVDETDEPVESPMTGLTEVTTEAEREDSESQTFPDQTSWFAQACIT